MEIKRKAEDNIIKGGKDKVHVLADFDGTLTKEFVNGVKVLSAISILREKNYISKEYSEKAHALANHYMPIEKNPDVPIKEKKKAMLEWWTKHFELLIKSRLNKRHLKMVVDDERMQLRGGVPEFINILHKNNIPLVIMSSAGLGDLIPMFLEKHNLLCSNMHVIGNFYKWDKKGNAVDVQKPILHSMNKDETFVRNYPFYGEVKHRKNVILLGNGLGDFKMIEGFDYDNLLKIGFLDENVEKNKEYYGKHYDVVLVDNASFNYVNKLMKEIVK